MSECVSSDSRWSVEDGPQWSRFIVRPTRLWPIAIFLGAWLAGWTAGEVSAVRALAGIHGSLVGVLLLGGFLVLWLAGWTAAGVFCWSIFLYSLFGFEEVSLEPGLLRLRWRALCFYWTREFDAREIGGFRVTALSAKGTPGTGGSLAALFFRHPGGRMLFGLGLRSEDATGLLWAMKSRGRLPPSAFDVDPLEPKSMDEPA